MATARIRFRAGSKFGWIDYDDAHKAILVDHPEQAVHVSVIRHFEEPGTFYTPAARPPGYEDVTDYFDTETGTGYDSMDFFIRRANALASQLMVDGWEDAKVFWKASETPEGY